MLFNYRCVNTLCLSFCRRSSTLSAHWKVGTSVKSINTALFLPKKFHLAGVETTQVRYLRTKGPSDNHRNNEEKSNKENETENEQDKEKTPKDEFEKFTRVFEENMRKRLEEMSKQKGIKVEVRSVDVKKAMKTMMITWFLIGSAVSLGIMYFFMRGSKRKTEYDHHFPRAPHISSDEFFSKYLPTGEVQRIVIFPTRNIAVALLHHDAVIDGQLAKDHSYIINCNARKLSEQIRRVEERMNIPLKDGVHIEIVNDYTVFNLIQFLIGMGILGFLGYQYARLMRSGVNQWRSNGKNPFGGGGNSGQ